MGINKLNNIIKQQCPDCMQIVPISTFADEYIAIDLSILIHASFAYILKFLDFFDFFNYEIDETLLSGKLSKEILRQISEKFIKNKLKPIFVLDGQRPDLKLVNASKKRKQIKENYKIKFDNLLNILKLRKVTMHNIDNIDLENLITFKKQSINITKNMNDNIIQTLESHGYPMLQAVNEAEELCTKLCIDKKVKAVYSTDTDNIVRKCPIMITKIYKDDEQNTIAHITMYNVEIHRKLGLNYSQFIDFCIMNGCDYNNRIDNIRQNDIIYALICFGSIEEIENNNKDIDFSKLNYKQCRELFKERSIKECCVSTSYDTLQLLFS